MDIARASIEKPVNTWLIILICLLGGIWGLLTLGRLEDPDFTIKEAIITTAYPGASALEVEQEVTDQLETAIQRLPQVKEVRSRSTPGMSQITVEMESHYNNETLPQVWDELRRKVNDVQALLPPGAQPSIVNDDFGDVFGLYYALTAPDYPQADLRDFGRTLRQKLLQVPGVAKVVLSGLRDERIYVEIPQAVMTHLGIPPTTIANALAVQNQVVDSGAMRVDDQYIRLSPSGAFTSVERIQSLFLSAGPQGGGNTIRLGDIAEITRGYEEVPTELIRHNGTPAITIGISAQSGANIVEIGKAVEAKLAEVMQTLPVGVELQPIYEQHKVVDLAVSGFIVNLASSVAIVILVLCVAMGWRGGIVVGGVLLLTVLGTLLVMKVFGITMQRVSLGALIVAMGMLVDNAIVIAEGMMVRMKRGLRAKAAASEIAGQTQMPLLAATVIGILAFSGIGLSDDATGEYTFSLFAVIGISLMLSWVLAVTVTPLLASYLFKTRSAEEAEAAGEAAMLRGYRHGVEIALRHRVITMVSLVGLTVAAVIGFSFVKQSFFPDSATPIFYIDYWRQQGTDIRATAEDMAAIEAHLLDMEGITDVSTFIGGGADRMMLVYTPERPNSAYGQFIVRAEDAEQIPAIASEALQWLAETYPQAEAKVERVRLGPGSGAKIEARFSGEDPAVLRELSEQAQDIFREAGLINVRHDWRQREKLIIPRMAEDRATSIGVTRADIADALAMATEGRQVGLYREGDRLIPSSCVRPSPSAAATPTCATAACGRRHRNPMCPSARWWTISRPPRKTPSSAVWTRNAPLQPRQIHRTGPTQPPPWKRCAHSWKPSTCRRATSLNGAESGRTPPKPRRLWQRACR